MWYRQNGLACLPVSTYLHALQTVHRSQRLWLHRRMRDAGLGHFAAMSPASATWLAQHVVTFATASGNLGGSESLFLACLHHLQCNGPGAAYLARVRAWRQAAEHGVPSSSPIVCDDRETRILTVFPGRALPALSRVLLAQNRADEAPDLARGAPHLMARQILCPRRLGGEEDHRAVHGGVVAGESTPHGAARGRRLKSVDPEPIVGAMLTGANANVPA